MMHLPLGAGREFDRIRSLMDALGDRAATLGDDCAVLSPVADPLVLSVDASVEGVHFRRDWLTMEEVGWRATAAALSDLAGEGAAAIGVLAAVTAPRDAADGDVPALMRGVADAAAAAGGRVLGGDLTAGPVWMVGVTVVGRAARPVTRAGAEPGDGLWVTGTLGGARVALEALLAGRVPPPQARAAFAQPEPRLVAGQWLAAHGARSMLDVSDGLGGDAAHLAAASGVALRIALDHVPVAADTIEAARSLGIPAQRYAAEGGEDYELLVTLPATFGEPDVIAFERACGIALTRIGEVRTGRGVRCTLGGVPVTLEGFDHFR